MNMRETHGAAVKAHVQAMVVMPLLTEATVPARARWRNRNALSHRQAAHGFAQFRHNARDFMAQHHRLFDAHRSKPALVVVMQVGPTNAAIRLSVKGVKTQIVRSVAEQSFHKELQS